MRPRGCLWPSSSAGLLCSTCNRSAALLGHHECVVINLNHRAIHNHLRWIVHITETLGSKIGPNQLFSNWRQKQMNVVCTLLGLMKDNMCHAVEDSSVRLRQAVHYASFHRISLILSPDVSFHCVGINRTAKHRRFQLQDNGNQCRAQSELMRKMKTWDGTAGVLRVVPQWGH